MQNAEEKSNNTNPINQKHEVQKSNDPRIDQDFENFPHGTSKENIINPKKDADFKTADAEDIKSRDDNKEDNIKEMESDGSGGAFESTEEVAHNYGKNTDVEKNRNMEGAEDY